MSAAVAARIRRARHADEAATARLEAWVADPQHSAWLTELDAAIDTADLPRLEAAQAALRATSRVEMGWPATDTEPAVPPRPPARLRGAYARRARKETP